MILEVLVNFLVPLTMFLHKSDKQLLEKFPHSSKRCPFVQKIKLFAAQFVLSNFLASYWQLFFFLILVDIAQQFI